MTKMIISSNRDYMPSKCSEAIPYHERNMNGYFSRVAIWRFRKSHKTEYSTHAVNGIGQCGGQGYIFKLFSNK